MSFAEGGAVTGDALRGTEAKSIVAMHRRAQMCRNAGAMGSCQTTWWIALFFTRIVRIDDWCQGGVTEDMEISGMGVIHDYDRAEDTGVISKMRPVGPSQISVLPLGIVLAKELSVNTWHFA